MLPNSSVVTVKLDALRTHHGGTLIAPYCQKRGEACSMAQLIEPVGCPADEPVA